MNNKKELNEYQDIILTFDLEYWYESPSIKKYLKGNENESLLEFVFGLMAILNLYHANATFFVSGKVVQNEPEIIKQINKAGHEIALHSWDHKTLWNLEPEQFATDTKKLFEGITALTGKKPIGHRAANFSLDQKTKWALPILRDCGLIYDSSVFPFWFSRIFFFMYKKFLYGVKSKSFPPYYIDFTDPSKEDKSSGLLEIPLSIFHFGYIKLPLTGGIYIRIIPWLIFKILMQRKLKTEPTCIHFHPYDIGKQKPNILMPAIKKFIKYYNTGKTMKKLEYLLAHYHCVSAEKYIEKTKI